MSAMALENFSASFLAKGKITVLSTFGSINRHLVMKPQGQVHGKIVLGLTPSGKVCEALVPRNNIKL